MSPFFTSRWVAPLDHMTELGDDGDVGLPAGFRAAGVTAQLKPSGAPDVGLIACDSLAVTSHAMFTRSGTQAAPVLVSRAAESPSGDDPPGGADREDEHGPKGK